MGKLELLAVTGIKRATLQRRVTWVCGCVLDYPLLDSDARPTWWDRLRERLGLINQPVFVIQCRDVRGDGHDGLPAPNHYSFRERALMVKEARRVLHG